MTWIQPASFLVLIAIYGVVVILAFFVTLKFGGATLTLYDCLIAALAWPIFLCLAYRTQQDDDA